MNFEKTPPAAHLRINIYRLKPFLTPLRSRWTVPLRSGSATQQAHESHETITKPLLTRI
jgi:hypothetical protein